MLHRIADLPVEGLIHPPIVANQITANTLFIGEMLSGLACGVCLPF